MNQQRSLKQLLIGYLCVAIVVVVLVGLVSLYMVQDLYFKQTAEDLQVRARLCSKPISERIRQDDTGAVDALCKELGRQVNTRITVIRPDGLVIGDTEKDPATMENHANRPEIRQVLDDPSEVGTSTRYSTTLEDTLMYVAVALGDDGSPAAVVRTSIPITTLRKRLHAAYRGVLTAGLVGVLVIIFAIPWFTIRLKPLGRDEPKPRRRRPDEEEYDWPPSDDMGPGD